MVYRIKQYDTKTGMKATLLSEGKPVNLTPSEVTEVRFLLSLRKQIIIDKPVFIDDALAGKVWFPFEENETVKAGIYAGEFVIFFTDGRRETFPNSGTIPVEITASNFALTKTP